MAVCTDKDYLLLTCDIHTIKASYNNSRYSPTRVTCMTSIYQYMHGLWSYSSPLPVLAMSLPALMSHLKMPKQEGQPYPSSLCKQYSTLNLLGQMNTRQIGKAISRNSHYSVIRSCLFSSSTSPRI